MSPWERFTAQVQATGVRTALVLGSGMGALDRRFARLDSLSFAEVPGLIDTSVKGHRGCLTLAQWAGQIVLLFEGRLHFYEGHPWERVVQPVRLAAQLGCRTLLLTNAAGGIHDTLGPRSLMALRAHLEWTRPNWWREPERPSPYSPWLLQLLAVSAAQCGIPLLQGVYAQLTGPCYETPAEIRALKTWGADAVGMSTAREAQMGQELGMECGALSLIANRAAGLSGEPLSHKEVLEAVAAGAERLADLLETALPRLAPTPATACQNG